MIRPSQQRTGGPGRAPGGQGPLWLGPWLPNLLSLTRLATAPFVVCLLLSGRVWAAFWLLAIALSSDALDGLVARRWGLSSAFGSLIDPLADKVLLLAALASLWWLSLVPGWFLALAALRDLALGLGAWLLPGPWRRRVEPSFSGRATTLLLSLFVLALVADLGGLALPETLLRVLLAAAGLGLLASAADYAWHACLALRRRPA